MRPTRHGGREATFLSTFLTHFFEHRPIHLDLDPLFDAPIQYIPRPPCKIRHRYMQCGSHREECGSNVNPIMYAHPPWKMRHVHTRCIVHGGVCVPRQRPKLVVLAVKGIPAQRGSPEVQEANTIVNQYAAQLQTKQTHGEHSAWGGREDIHCGSPYKVYKEPQWISIRKGL